MVQPLLEFSHTEIRYGSRTAVEDLSLTVSPGEILGIVGQSGSGKSTVVKAAMGLLGPEGAVTDGKILFRGQDLSALTPEQMRRLRGREMGMVFQNCTAALCPIRTIWEQLRESVGRELPRKEIRSRALELMERVHLADGERVLRSYPFELSGGMNQRVGIVMAMLRRPDLLLADEPTSALDVTVQKQVVEEMLGLREAYGTAIVLVTHNIGVVERMADRVAVMHRGCLVEWGDREQVLRSPKADYTRALIAAVPRLRRA